MDVIDHFEVRHPRLDRSFHFSADGLDTVGNTVRDNGLAAYEAPVTDIIIEILRNSPGLFLDVGANTGLYTLAAAAVGPVTRVVAFEPLDSIRQLLQRNLALNPDLTSRITVEPVGLSNANGSFSFYETINDYGFISTSSSLEQRHAAQIGDSYVEREIKTRTLDDFGDTLGNTPISFMKVDVEGHEHAVITGGRRFIKKHRPIFSLEILSLAETGAIDSLLVEADYFAFAMSPDGLRQCEKATFFADAWNHLLVPSEKLAQVFTLCRRLSLAIELA